MAGTKEWGSKGEGLASVRRRPRARSVMRWKKREEDFLRPFCPCEEGLESADGSQYGSEEADKGEEEEERKEDGSKGSEVEGESMYEDGRVCEDGDEGGVDNMGEEGRKNELLSLLSMALLSCLRLRFLDRIK